MSSLFLQQFRQDSAVNNSYTNLTRNTFISLTPSPSDSPGPKHCLSHFIQEESLHLQKFFHSLCQGHLSIIIPTGNNKTTPQEVHTPSAVPKVSLHTWGTHRCLGSQAWLAYGTSIATEVMSKIMFTDAEWTEPNSPSIENLWDHENTELLSIRQSQDSWKGIKLKNLQLTWHNQLIRVIKIISTSTSTCHAKLDHDNYLTHIQKYMAIS